MASNSNNWSIKPYFLSQFYNLNINKYLHLNNMLKLIFIVMNVEIIFLIVFVRLKRYIWDFKII